MGGLILEGGFTSLPEMAQALAPSWLPIDWLVTQKFATLEKIPNVPAPVLLVHGTGDRMVPHRFSEALYAAARSPKKLVLVEGGSHYNTSWVGAAEYRAAIAELFEVPRASSVRRRRVVVAKRGRPSTRRRDRSLDAPVEAAGQLDLAAGHAAARQAAEPAHAAAAGLRDHEAGLLLAAQVGDLLHRAVERRLRGGAVARDRLGDRLRLDLEADRQRADLRHDLRLARVHGRALRVVLAARVDRHEHADRAEAAVGVDLLAAQRGDVHLDVVGAFVRGGHGGFRRDSSNEMLADAPGASASVHLAGSATRTAPGATNAYASIDSAGPSKPR